MNDIIFSTNFGTGRILENSLHSLCEQKPNFHFRAKFFRFWFRVEMSSDPNKRETMVQASSGSNQRETVIQAVETSDKDGKNL